MCGRYGRRTDKQRIAEWFHTHNTDVFDDEYYEINSTRLAPSYNISPESIQPVVRLDHETGKHVLALMKWGLVPYWSKTPKANFSSINARSDKLVSRGAWREPWKHRRCLIPANFFFEWEPLTKEDEKKKLSKPWAVSLADDSLFAFGGIWDRWKGQSEDKNEIIIESFSIVTTDPNEVLEPFHNRCPLIIEPKDYERWLEPGEPSPLLVVFPVRRDQLDAAPFPSLPQWIGVVTPIRDHPFGFCRGRPFGLGTRTSLSVASASVTPA